MKKKTLSDDTKKIHLKQAFLLAEEQKEGDVHKTDVELRRRGAAWFEHFCDGIMGVVIALNVVFIVVGKT